MKIELNIVKLMRETGNISGKIGNFKISLKLMLAGGPVQANYISKITVTNFQNVCDRNLARLSQCCWKKKKN